MIVSLISKILGCYFIPQLEEVLIVKFIQTKPDLFVSTSVVGRRDLSANYFALYKLALKPVSQL